MFRQFINARPKRDHFQSAPAPKLGRFGTEISDHYLPLESERELIGRKRAEQFTFEY